MTDTTRCNWCGDDPLMIAYHDTEWGMPLRDSRGLREALVLDGFQAGLSCIYRDMAANGEDFATVVWGVAGRAPAEGVTERAASTPASAAMERALKARGFRFVGLVIVHAWMQAIGMVNDHAPGCFRRAAVRALA